MLASAAIDYIYLGIFSRGKLIGGVLFLAGLAVNARLDALYAQQEPNRTKASCSLSKCKYMGYNKIDQLIREELK
ncbi:MAG TPA: hypothetical protein VN549_07390 [Negativicutes bacterium]|nr:hypothetical protein [Negativicutes bacterium]